MRQMIWQTSTHQTIFLFNHVAVIHALLEKYMQRYSLTPITCVFHSSKSYV